MRLVAKHKKTGEYVDVGAIWPCRFAGQEFPMGVTLGSTRANQPLTKEEAAAILCSEDYFVDLRENGAPRKPEGSEDGLD
jgi:hypothetical protein